MVYMWPRRQRKKDQRKLKYNTLYTQNSDIPLWIDETLRKAVHVDPYKRYDELSEFTYDLRHPNPKYLKKVRQPLLDRNPIVFWKIIALIESIIIGILLVLGV
jgi:ribosomal protein L39E